MAGDEVFYSDFDRGGDPPPEQPVDECDRAREALATELLHRYRRLTADAIREFVPREQHRDYRAGSEHDLMIAVYRLQSDRERVAPGASELDTAHGSVAGLTLHNAIHAVTVGDLLSEEDFAFLTAPLGELLNVDIAARQPELRVADAPPPGPAVPYDAPVAEPLPGHPLWAYTRERLIALLEAIGRDSGPDVYVVHLHLDDQWEEDVRHAGVEIRWSTEEDLADRRRRWNPHPDLLEINSRAADELAWDWVRFRRADDVALWSPDIDRPGHDLLADYGRTLGLWYSDAELRGDDEDVLFERRFQLADFLHAGLPTVLRELHDGGEVARIFGRPIPITFSAHDEHAPAWEWARNANPPELYQLFGPIHESQWGPG